MNLQNINWNDISLLKGLNQIEIDQVLAAGKLLELQAGEYVFHVGDTGNEMFMILSGSVRVETIVGGSRQILAKFNKGQIFGEIAFVARRNRTADVIAEETLELMEISQSFLQNLIQQMPETAAKISFNLSLILGERLVNTTRSLIESEYHNILILFQTIASETEVRAVFEKFVAALVKALPRVGAVEFLTKDANLLWYRPGFTPYHPDFELLEKQRTTLIDEKNYMTACPIRIAGHTESFLVLTQDPGVPLSANEVDLLMKVSTQLCLVIDRIRLYEETKEMATTDPLTGLYNRNIFKKELAKEVVKSRRYGSNVSLLIADLDHFKHVNDSYGHLAGDEVLREVAASFNKMVRNYDTICRYGGEEFVMILPMTDITGAQVIAERIRHNVESLSINFNGQTIPITVSIGAATYQGEEIEEFFQRADKAVYQSKSNGRNRVSIAE